MSAFFSAHCFEGSVWLSYRDKNRDRPKAASRNAHAKRGARSPGAPAGSGSLGAACLFAAQKPRSPAQSPSPRQIHSSAPAAFGPPRAASASAP